MEATCSHDAPENSPAQPTLPTVMGYVVTEVLGKGGGGSVYRAVAVGSDTTVALKVVRGVCGFDPNNKRSQRELEMQASLRLPCVPRVFDYGTTDGNLYIVTEYIQGIALDEYCTSHALDRRQRVMLLCEVCRCVQLIHEHALLHRDLKPSNILIESKLVGEGNCAEGVPGVRPWIIDFGLARIATSGVELSTTIEGLPLGTPVFMAPELARGEHSTITTRADVYSLGAIGYLLLAGDTPHASSADLPVATLVSRAATTPTRDPREIDPLLPRTLSAVLAKACAFNPDARYGSAAEFADDLSRWLNGEQIEAQPASMVRRLARWFGRHPVVSTVLASVSLGLMVFVGFMLGTWWLHTVPDRIERMVDNSSALLRSRDGSVLCTYGNGVHENVRACELVSRPARLGGGRVIVGAWSDAIGRPIEARIMDAWHPSRRLWTAPVVLETPAVFKDSNDRMETIVHAAKVADVLPDPPGEEGTQEIVVLHRNPNYSPICLRVYDLAGNVKFEAWHNGWLYGMFWLPPSGPQERGTLLLTGVSNDTTIQAVDRIVRPNKPIDGVASETVDRDLSKYTVVVFALRPTGFVSASQPAPIMIAPTPLVTNVSAARPVEPSTAGNVWLTASAAVPEARATDAMSLVWYRYLQPWSVNAWVPTPMLTTPNEPGFSGQAVRLFMRTSPPITRSNTPCPLPKDLWLTLDRDGQTISSGSAK